MRLAIAGNIAKARTDGEERANNAARNLIRSFVPEGLDLIYAEKARQARTVIASPGRAEAAAHRFVAEDAALAGISVADAAAAIIVEADRWSHAASKIENLRHIANSTLRMAQTLAEIETAVAGVSQAALDAALSENP